ncbi:hypothetical protein L1887_26552 [Cichorium endivia]|nr:hypothetical protein L1887_26552 [Cichorium endivia]
MMMPTISSTRSNISKTNKIKITAITPHLSRGNFCSESNPNFFPLQPRIHQSNFLLESLLIDSIEYIMME